jgi:hypothetical protein
MTAEQKLLCGYVCIVQCHGCCQMILHCASCAAVASSCADVVLKTVEVSNLTHVLQGAGLAAGALGAGAAGGMAAHHTGDHGTTGFQVCDSTCCTPNAPSAAHSGTLATISQTLNRNR